MTKIIGFLRAKRTTQFHCQKFGLSSATVFSNENPIAGKPLTMHTNEKIFSNNLEALSSGNHGNCIAICDYSSLSLLVLFLISTQQASQDYPITSLPTHQFQIALSEGFGIQYLSGFSCLKNASMIFLIPTKESRRVFFCFKINFRSWPTRIVWQRWLSFANACSAGFLEYVQENFCASS